MKDKLTSKLFFLSALATPSVVCASQSERSSTPPGVGLLLLILFVICYSRRKKAIGGWLLYYFIQLFLGAFVLIVTSLLSLSNFNPSNYDSTALFLLFVLTVIPGHLLLLVQIVLAFRIIPQQHREWKYVNILRIVLALDLFFALIAVPIDLVHWRENIIFDVFALIWPLVWLPYFSFSKRVRSVYQTKDWESLHQPGGA